jgi:hypothetical protein
MGKKLEGYYDYIEEKMGREGKVKLARLTHTPSVIVGGMPDDAETVAQFREAIKELTGNYPP